MDDNILRQVDVDDAIVFYTDNQYSLSNRQKFLDVFQKLKDDKKILSEYNDTVWICSSGIKSFRIDFTYKGYAYKTHMERKCGINFTEMTDMLKCYAVYICGDFIFMTIAKKIVSIKTFLTRFGDEEYSILETEKITIINFLNFIGIPEHQISMYMDQIPVVHTPRPQQRELCHLINYMAAESELTDMYSSATLPDSEFLHWFPVYFWTHVTFVLPLRATEMLVTPYECLECRDGKIFLMVRRTMLKKGKRTVCYDIEKDYKIFSYPIPESDITKNIRKYQELTRGHQRRFLFDFEYSVNGILSLQAFNALLTEFISVKLQGNHKYDYAKFASGISEFSIMSAGDSRPIAMANLFYQDVGADICRQLADHIHISTSAGYYTNVGSTVLASSIMHLQRQLNRERQSMDLKINRAELQTGSSCGSPKNPFVTGDISDCIAEEKLEECLGCKYYTPTNEELSAELECRNEKLDNASKRIIECMANGKEITDKMDKLFLDAHTSITRYRVACNEVAKEKLRKWQRHKPTAKTFC